MQPRFVLWTILVGFCLAAPVSAGTMDVAWDPMGGVNGFRVYYGTSSGQYTDFADVGDVTQTTLDDLVDCTRYYVAVRAYNLYGESTDSNEISGWARPSILPGTTQAVQGSQALLNITGANFDLGAQVAFDTGSIPVAATGDPLLVFDSVAVLDCDRIQALVTIEPTAFGFQPVPIGSLPIVLDVRNPDGVFNTGTVTLDVQFNETRADINRLHARTVDRVNGDDLASFARGFASSLGQAGFEFDCDLDGDTDIDGDDLALFSTVFGKCRVGSVWTDDPCP